MHWLGDNPVGWRVAAGVAGTGVVLLVYLLGARVLGRPAAILAAVLTASDGLLFVQSRLAMLDVFVALFVVLGAWLLTLCDSRSVVPPAMVLAGAAFGLAAGMKWSGFLALAAAAAVALQQGGPAVPVAVARGAALVTVAAVGYLSSYLPSAAVGDGVPLWRHQVQMLRYHTTFKARAEEASPAYTWPALSRPVTYYWDDCPHESAEPSPTTGVGFVPTTCTGRDQTQAQILALGNPVLWWIAPAFVVELLYLAWKRRVDAAWIFAPFVTIQYVPWLFVTRPAYPYYLTPVVPFVALTVAWGVSQVDTWKRQRREGRWRPWAMLTVGGLAVCAFAFFYPVLTATPLPSEEIALRWWLPGWRPR